MKRDGHLGVALGAYAPIGFATTVAGYRELAFLGAGLAVAVVMLPDVDVKIPLLPHRSYTHTVWFALLVGVACGAIPVLAGQSVGGVPPSSIAALAGITGATTVCSHVAADALTPMGVRPFAPFGGHYSLGVVGAANRTANLVLFLAGVGTFLGVLTLATVVA